MINPGPSAWIYWAYNNGSNDYQIVKEYIDLAAEMNWPYNLIDWKWNEMGNGGSVDDAVDYANERVSKRYYGTTHPPAGTEKVHPVLYLY